MVGGPIKQVTRQWLKHAAEDLDTARFLLRARKYLYVGFMCQQAVEKLLKAVICQEMGITPPRTHNLIALSDLIDAHLDDTQRDFLTLLTEYYLNNRYPEVKLALSRRMTRSVAGRVLRDTESILQWFREKFEIPNK